MLPTFELDASKRKGLALIGRAAFFYFLTQAHETNVRVNGGSVKGIPEDLQNLQYVENHGTFSQENPDKIPPNLVFEGLRVWWSVGSRHDPTTDLDWKPNDWGMWLDRVIERLGEYEERNLRRMMLGSDALVKV